MFVAFFAHLELGSEKKEVLQMLYGINTLLATFPIVTLYWALFVAQRGVLGLYLMSVLLKALILWGLFFSPWHLTTPGGAIEKFTFLLPFFLALLMEIYAFSRFNSAQGSSKKHPAKEL